MIRLSGTAADLHGRQVDWARPSVVRCDVTEPAVVLGSTQPLPAAPTLPVVRRRSGGGAVLVGPGDPLWVDVVLPRGDPRWVDDVGRAFWWLGELWVDALGAVGVPGASVHRGGLCATRWSRVVCFGGIGPGEVVDAEGRKVVGIAQRRTRDGALFQCAVYAAWDPAPLVRCLGLPDESVDELRLAAAGVGAVADLERLATRFAPL